MKKIFLIVFLILVLCSFLGCTKTEQSRTIPLNLEDKTSKETKNQETSAERMTFQKMYRLDKVKSYEYRIKSNTGNGIQSMNVKYSISSDAVNGKSAWLQTTETQMEQGKVTTKMWLDKTTLKCLKIVIESEFMGQKMQQDSSCPQEGLGSEKTLIEETPKKVGSETITVPAGTFKTDKYSIENTYYYIAPEVPIPVKYTVGNDVVMELVSYS